MIFKKYWLIKEKIFKYKRSIKISYGRFYKSEEFKKAGIKLVNNTKEEKMMLMTK